MTTLGLAAFIYFLLSRIAYAGGVGWMLRREHTDQHFTRAFGVEGGWQRFRRRALWIMNNDGIAFVAVVVTSAGTMGLPGPVWLRVATGVVLCIAGIGIKAWAAKLLGDRGYHWHNFFAPDLEHDIEMTGPYRWFRNPMYTVGYLQTYGLALIFDSWPALAAAVFAQAAILAFYVLVEKPHFEQLLARQTGAYAARRRVRTTQPPLRATRD